MTPYSIIFTNNFGKLAYVVFATSQEEAIKKALATETVKSFRSVEAVLILNPLEGKSIRIEQP